MVRSGDVFWCWFAVVTPRTYIGRCCWLVGQSESYVTSILTRKRGREREKNKTHIQTTRYILKYMALRSFETGNNSKEESCKRERERERESNEKWPVRQVFF